MSVPPKRRSWAGPAAEAGLVIVVIGLLFVAALAGFLVGRANGEDNGSPAVSQPTTQEQPTTQPAATTESVPSSTQSESADGAAVFAKAGCGGCHTFGPAKSTGTVGPKLDGIDLSKDEIAQQVRNGGDGMPAFGDRLSDAEIEAVADYVDNG